MASRQKTKKKNSTPSVHLNDQSKNRQQINTRLLYFEHVFSKGEIFFYNITIHCKQYVKPHVEFGTILFCKEMVFLQQLKFGSLK